MREQADSSGFNLSRWAIEHAALTRYLLVVLMAIGLASYFQLGQDEDPPFTFRTMVIKATWPGASPQQMADQVADKIERTLQEITGVDKIRSFSKAGELTILFNVSEATTGRDVDYTWYTIRKRSVDCRALCRRVCWGHFSMTNLAMCMGLFTRWSPMVSVPPK